MPLNALKCFPFPRQYFKAKHFIHGKIYMVGCVNSLSHFAVHIISVIDIYS